MGSTKKLTLGFVKKEFEKEGYTLLSTEYKGTHEKLEVLCPKKHFIEFCYSSFQQNQRCAICARNKKKTIKEVRREFEKEGYTLLSTGYKNNHQKLKVWCSKKHLIETTYHYFQQNHRCKECADENKKKTIKEVRREFEKRRYTLQSKKYKSCNTKLKVLCPRKHSIKITYSNFQQGRGCKKCARENKEKLFFENTKKEFKKRGYVLLSTEYKSSKQKLKALCSKKHLIEIRYSNFQQGQRCRKCADENKKKTIKEVRREFEKRRYTLQSKKYKSNKQKLEVHCPKKHSIKITYGSFQRGQGCGKCYRENNKGSNNPRWNGGTSFEPYPVEFTKSLKKEIKKRDDYKCQNPDCFKKSKRLCVHHIDYIKENCNSTNLITVCISCNSRANTDREMWKLKYQNIIKEKYIIITNSF